MITRRTLFGLIPLPIAARIAGAAPATGQPIPLLTKVVHLRVGRGWATTVLRKWRKEDIPRCKLCDPGECSAFGNLCMISASRLVTKAEASALSTVGMTWQEHVRV